MLRMHAMASSCARQWRQLCIRQAFSCRLLDFIVYSVHPCFSGLNNLFSVFNRVNFSGAYHRNLNNPEVCLLKYTTEAIVLKMSNDTLYLEKVVYLEKVDIYAFLRF